MSNKNEIKAEQGNTQPQKDLLRHGAEILLFLVLAGLLLIALQLIPEKYPTAGEGGASSSAYPPYPPPGEMGATPTTAALKPPPCEFSSGIAPEASGPSLDDYVFSEPQVVLTSTVDIALVEWLPDNQRVLITEYIPEGNQQSIELFDVQSGERQVFAIRKRIDEPPAWLSALNAVLYPVMNILRIDEINHRYEFTHQVWVSYGSPNRAHLVADNLAYFAVAASPDSNRFAYLAKNHLIQRNRSLEVVQSLPFDPTQWEYRRNISPPAVYKMAWRPGSSQIFLYSNGDAGGYTFLLDVNTGRVCEVNLGGWAGVARWSPDGRYLAVVRSWGSLPIKSSDLAVLDAETGMLYTITLIPAEMKGHHFVDDITWAANNRNLIAIGRVMPFQGSEPGYEGNEYRGLYLIDFLSGQSIHILPEYQPGGGWWGTNLIWALDGSKLMTMCSGYGMERLCLIYVQRRDLP